MESGTFQLCPDNIMAELLRILQTDDDAGITFIAQLQATYPDDPRLHFLKGSVLAGLQRYAEGREAMARAVEIAPGYDLARFQLGFLELTSGMAAEAAQSWEPFALQADEAPFRLLSEGLNCLARDDFDGCDRLLRLGMAANEEHPMINSDMQLILDEISGNLTMNERETVENVQPASATHLLLQQFELKDSANKTRH